jgi:predicted transcriptional regulator
MSIHPEYAEAIISGRKRAEFRKRPLADDIDLVLIYATAPVSAIIGWFTVRETVKTTPKSIWNSLHDVAGISWSEFSAYYSDCSEAVALLVGEAKRLSRPMGLKDLTPQPPTPQSFNYLPADILDQVGITNQTMEQFT